MRSASCHSNTVTHFARRIAFYKGIGERVRAAREAAGISQLTLASACGLAKATINKMEEGMTCPLYAVALIAQTLDGVSLDDLVPLIEDP